MSRLDGRTRYLQLRRHSATAAVLLAATVLSATLALEVVRATNAGALCVAASVVFAPTSVAAGQRVLVTGSAWGDNCYDTGQPPAGLGSLGNPLEDIEIVLSQGDQEWVLATVDADEEYEFSIAATVPSDVALGSARFIARRTSFGTEVEPVPSPEVTITELPPGATLPEPTTSAPDDEPTTTVVDPEVADDSSFPTVPVAIAAAVLLALVVAFLLRRSRAGR